MNKFTVSLIKHVKSITWKTRLFKKPYLEPPHFQMRTRVTIAFEIGLLYTSAEIDFLHLQFRKQSNLKRGRIEILRQIQPNKVQRKL